MNPEQEFGRTKERTEEILEIYRLYLMENVLNKFFKNVPYTFTYEVTSKYFDYDAIYYLNNERKLHAEVKVRMDIELETYPDSKLPLRKHGVALYYFNNHNIKTHYLVAFSNGLYRCNLYEKPDDVRNMPSRWDRGGEINEYALYNQSRFELIG
jgi:hypothetical protein